VLLSPVPGMFQSNHMCPPWHRFPEYSDNVVLQGVI
jgi:hypothetical protein